MHFLRLHWFDVGLVLAAVASLFLLVTHPTGLALLLWLSLITLFLHQFEEYRFPDYLVNDPKCAQVLPSNLHNCPEC